MKSQQVTATAPGRVNLIGEHLDYNGGSCLPIAIPLSTRADVSLCEGGSTRCFSDDPQPGWERYPLGMLEALGVDLPLEIRIESRVPTGAGLSSSAALLCSVAMGVDALLNLDLSTSELVAATIRAETEFVGAPTGGLDQTVVMMAQSGRALEVNVSEGLSRQHELDLDALGVGIQVINTHVRHDHLTGGYGNRRQECDEARDLLGVKRLIDADPEDRRLPPVLQRRTKHVVSEQARVEQFIRAMASNDSSRMGQLMSDSHQSLRDDFEVSCTALDVAVESAIEAGALGARMTGGGFGGCAIALTPSGGQEEFRQYLLESFARSKLQQPTIFEVKPVGGAQVVGC